MSAVRYYFHLSFHTNYFDASDVIKAAEVYFEVTPSLGERLYDDKDEELLDLVMQIESDSNVTHDFFGENDGKFCTFGYSIYEADASEVDRIAEMWKEALGEKFGANNLGKMIRYDYEVPPEDDTDELHDSLFAEAIRSVPPVEENKE